MYNIFCIYLCSKLKNLLYKKNQEKSIAIFYQKWRSIFLLDMQQTILIEIFKTKNVVGGKF